MSAPRYRLGVLAGTGMLLGSLVGPGALALPSLSADAAGPASLVAWAFLLVASIPIATTFSALGARFPDDGGVSSFAARAFGARVAAPVGWWFFAAVPVGIVVAAIIGAQYLSAALGLHGPVPLIVGAGFLLVGFGANAAGLRVTGRAQVVVGLALCVLLLVTIVVSVPRIDPRAFTPFAPHGATSIATAATLLFFAFAGWEAATHLSARFDDPRSVTRATGLTLAIVTVLYLGIAVSTIGLDVGDSRTPLLTLLHRAFGTAGTTLTVVAATLLTFGAINAYVASGAQLGVALGRARTFPFLTPPSPAPGAHGRLSPTGRSLLALGAGSVLVITVALLARLELGALVQAASALLGAVTFAGALAGVRLLTGRAQHGARLASVLVGLVLLSCGWFLVLPAVVAGAALVYTRRRGTHLAADDTVVEPEGSRHRAHV
jgi:amino acid efflux transporter